MAIEFRLPGDLQERYGLPEILTWDPSKMMMDEAIEFEEATGIPFDELYSRMNGSNGQRRDLRVWKAVIWLAARREGAAVAYKDFDFNLLALQTVQPEAAAESADPKAPTAGRSTRARKSVDAPAL